MLIELVQELIGIRLGKLVVELFLELGIEL